MLLSRDNYVLSRDLIIQAICPNNFDRADFDDADLSLVSGTSASISGGLTTCPTLLNWSFPGCSGMILLLRFRLLSFDIFMVGEVRVT